MARIARETKRYRSDLTDEEWEPVAPPPKPGRRVRPREIEFREVISAGQATGAFGLRLADAARAFRPLADDLRPAPRRARRFLFQTIHDIELMLDRERRGRKASSSATAIDRQSVRAPHGESRGYDAGKKIVGRKRHIAVGTDGRLLMVNLTTADISDSAGAQTILNTIRKRRPWVKHLFADAAHDRLQLMDKAAYLRFVIEIIRRRRSEGLRSPAASLGHRTNLRLDDPLAQARSRLRAPHRRFSRHDPRRHGWRPHPQKRSSLISQTGSNE